MAQLALIAASGPNSTRNLETSMIEGVPLDTFRPLGRTMLQALSDHAPDGRVYCWGSRPGGSVTYWEKLAAGDVALVYSARHFPLCGRVYGKVHSGASRRVANDIWGGWRGTSETWEYMYFFDPVVEINAPKDTVMSALGYNPDDPVQRFFIPSSDRQANLVAQYGDLDSFLQSISRSSSLLRLGVAARTRDDAAIDEEMDSVASEYSGQDAEETIDELVKAAPPPERKLVRSVLKRKLKPRLQLKKLYADHCQVCGYRIEKKNGGFYSEAAHLTRLSVGLADLDVVQNMVVLCPNHHKMFDHGKMRIEWDQARGLIARGLGAPDVEMTNKHIGGHANGTFLPK